MGDLVEETLLVAVYAHNMNAVTARLTLAAFILGINTWDKLDVKPPQTGIDCTIGTNDVWVYWRLVRDWELRLDWYIFH